MTSEGTRRSDRKETGIRSARASAWLVVWLTAWLTLWGAASGCTNEASTRGAAAGEASLGSDALAEAVDPSRIVTLGGPVTEIVFALGHGEAVVASDRSSLFPAEVMALPRLSYLRQSSAEGILSLAPTVILGTDAVGPPPVVAQLRAAGVPLVLVEEAQTLAEAEHRILTLGEALGETERAEALVASIRGDLAEAEVLRPETPPSALFVYARGAGLVNVAGAETSASLALELAGAENAVTGFDGFRPITAEAVVQADPDVVVVTERGLASLGGVAGLFSLPGLSQTRAARAGRVVTVDDAALLGLGPRVGEAVAQLARDFSALGPYEADASRMDVAAWGAAWGGAP
jgi:iron complex transport system substrate-binding protein